jgi:hypothetical protein
MNRRGELHPHPTPSKKKSTQNHKLPPKMKTRTQRKQSGQLKGSREWRTPGRCWALVEGWAPGVWPTLSNHVDTFLPESWQAPQGRSQPCSSSCERAGYDIAWILSPITFSDSAECVTEVRLLCWREEKVGLSEPAPTSAPSKNSRSGISWMGWNCPQGSV